jgi:hypothetical protein
MIDAAWARRQEAQLFPNLPASKNQIVGKRRAWQNIAIFIVLLNLFGGSLALARLLVPCGTKLILSTWTASLVGMLGMWSVGTMPLQSHKRGSGLPDVEFPACMARVSR